MYIQSFKVISGQKKYKNSQIYIDIHLILAFLDISFMQSTIFASYDQLLYFINRKNHKFVNYLKCVINLRFFLRNLKIAFDYLKFRAIINRL